MKSIYEKLKDHCQAIGLDADELIESSLDIFYSNAVADKRLT